MRKLLLQQFYNEDIRLFEKWLYIPHIAKWYHIPLNWIDEVKKGILNSHFYITS